MIKAVIFAERQREGHPPESWVREIRANTWAGMGRELTKAIYGLRNQGWEIKTTYDPISRTRTIKVEFEELDN